VVRFYSSKGRNIGNRNQIYGFSNEQIRKYRCYQVMVIEVKANTQVE
jgi:hypothetical protein